MQLLDYDIDRGLLSELEKNERKKQKRNRWSGGGWHEYEGPTDRKHKFLVLAHGFHD